MDHSESQGATSRFTIWIALAAAALAFLLYIPSLRSGFVYDAEIQVLQDGYIHNRVNFFDVLTFRVLGRDVLDRNRPVELLSLMADSVFFGKKPFGYHLTNIGIHAVNVSLLFLLLVELLQPSPLRKISPSVCCCIAAFAAALLFAFHPVSVEPVAEISSRKDMLAVFFILISLLLAARWHGLGGWRGAVAFGGCVLGCLYAVGAKETGVAAPFLLTGYWLLYRRNEPVKRWLPLLAAAFFVTGAFVIARFALEPRASRIFLHQPEWLGGSPAMALRIQPEIWAFQIYSIFRPIGLSVDYQPENVKWIVLPWALVALAVFLLLQILLAWKSRAAAFGAVVFWLGLAPVSNPRLIVAVMIDEPSAGDYYGGSIAGPVFSRVMGSALRLLGVPTDAPVDNVVLPPPGDDVKEET